MVHSSVQSRVLFADKFPAVVLDRLVCRVIICVFGELEGLFSQVLQTLDVLEDEKGIYGF